jgi:hypothetical protein
MAKPSAKTAGRTDARARSEPVIDFKHLSLMTLDDRELENEVLELFDRQAGMLLARMAGATPAVIAAQAHTLKGSANGIGAWDVANAAADVEQAASGSDHAEIAGAAGRLFATVIAARAAITQRRRMG